MRYLIITDIHANIDAIEAIEDNYDQLIVLGDLVDYGPAPEETVRWIMARADHAVCGNHDIAMATGADCRSSPLSYAMSVATREFSRPRLSSEVLTYLHQLPRRAAVEAERTRFELVHATPRDPLFEYLNGDADDDTWLAAVGELAESESWLFVGHTHRPFVRRVGRITVVNPGSLGMPIDGDDRGCYAIWQDGEVTLKRVRYDVERAVKRLNSSGLPVDVAAKMAAVLRHAGRAG